VTNREKKMKVAETCQVNSEQGKEKEREEEEEESV
jgi:hypothetical protein